MTLEKTAQFILFAKHDNYQIKENGVGRSCRTHGREEKSIHNSSRKSRRRDHLEDFYVDGKLLLKDVDWIYISE